MSLRYAILASLGSQPQTGYAIARDFDRGVGYFWQASHQQIYRELGKLAAERAVTFEVVEQDGKPARKIYQLTARGQDALRDWLATPAAPPVVRDELLVRIFAGAYAERADLRAEIARHRAACATRIEEYEAIEARWFERPHALDRAQRFMHLTLRKGILTSRAALTWFDETLAAIDQMKS